MLNENQINALPERIVERLRQINTECLESIGAVIKNIGELRPKDVHQLQQMYDYGADLNKITLKLAEASKKNVSEIYEIFDIVAKENYNYARPFYDAKAIPFIHYDDNENLKQYVKSLAKQTVDEYVNITQHTAFAVFDKTGKDIAPLFDSNIGKKATSLSDTYTKIVDYAVTKVQLGEESYQSAMRGAMKALANSGIRDVSSYASGYSRRLDTAVRQNILWGIKECNQNVADMVGEEFGSDGYEVSYHSHPRPSHADMGGQQYAKGPARTVNGIHYPSFEEEALPLLNEFHCLHFKFSILLGVSKPAYDKKTLEKFKAEDNKTFEFEGKTYTKYEASQVQRKLETAIRYQRDLLDIAKAAPDNDLELEARDKINILLNKYSKFSDASGLPTKLERTRLTVTSKDVDKSVKSGIIKVLDDDNTFKVNTGGKRNEKPLTKKQIEEVTEYAVSLGMPRDKIYYVDYDTTAYGVNFDLLRIGTDAFPLDVRTKNPNSNISMHGAIAHEIVGHRRAAQRGWTQADYLLEEVQASIRAARFTPDLTYRERITLIRDGLQRLRNNGVKLRDVKHKLYIEEE